MSIDLTQNKQVSVAEAPSISGLSFRHYEGEADIPKIVAVLERSKTADGIEKVDTVESVSRQYSNLKNCDPYKDVLIAEIEGKAVGYSRVTWWLEKTGSYIYNYIGFLVPEWRGKGIERAMLLHGEAQLREKAAEHEHTATPFFDTFAMESQSFTKELLTGEGYSIVREGYEMVRPNLSNIPEIPMPDGLEVRPVLPEHLHAIWEAEIEAFMDHWGADVPEEGDFERWQRRPLFQPELWQVAWEGEQVAGMIRNFINPDENTRFNRKRGYTENISVRRPWRRRGLARALLARSFQLHKDLGMTEAALGVDTENPSGALQLYSSMGFEVVKRELVYRKPL